MAAELKECLAGLPRIEDADKVRVCGEGCKEMRVVGRCGEAEEGRRVRHRLLSFGGRHAPRRAYPDCISNGLELSAMHTYLCR